jgi:hypothetical protein
MIPVSKVIDNYPNIANFFTEDWFKLELMKNEEDIHLLAKQLTFNENSKSSFVYLDHVERCLNGLKDNIKGHEHYFKALKHKERYFGILAELEIGLMIKNMGFEFEIEPSIVNGFSDIKITNAEAEIFIEISTKEGLSYEEIEKIGYNCTISRFETRPPEKFKGKIIKESKQLSKTSPGIFALVIEPSSIPEIESIKNAFGFSRLWGEYIELGIDPSEKVKKRVSALLIYCNYTTINVENNCFCRKEDSFLCVNPQADFPLPTFALQKFEVYGTEIIQPSLFRL